MKIIKLLSEKIHDELDDACSYAKLAIEYRDTYRSAGDTFYTLAQDEMRHQMMLHNEVASMIETYRRENGEPPENMLAVYDYLHERAIEKAEGGRFFCVVSEQVFDRHSEVIPNFVQCGLSGNSPLCPLGPHCPGIPKLFRDRRRVYAALRAQFHKVVRKHTATQLNLCKL